MIGVVIVIFSFVVGLQCYKIFLEYRMINGITYKIHQHEFVDNPIVFKDIVIIDSKNKEHKPSNMDNLL